MNIFKLFRLLFNISQINSSLIETKKTCSNCKFYIRNTKECSKLAKIDIVTGKKDYNYAITIRNNENNCGKEAKYFEKNYFKFITVPYYYILEHWQILTIIGVYTIPYAAIFGLAYQFYKSIL